MDESTGMRYKLQVFIKSHISKFSDEVLKNFEKNEKQSREYTNELKNNTMELFSEYSEIVKQSIHDNKIAIETADRPGLLIDIAKVFFKQDISIYSSRINTLGDKVEDTFEIEGKNKAKISTTKVNGIIKALKEVV